MAEHNAIKYAANYITKAAKRAFGLDDQQDSVTRLSESLGIYANFFDTINRPDWAWVRGELLWSVSALQSAVVGEFSQVGISNPASSNKLIIIDGMQTVGALNQTETRIGANPTAGFTATSSPTQRDSRIPGVSAPSGVVAVSFANHAVARIGTLLEDPSTPSTEGELFSVQVVLSPGFFWAMGPSSNNATVNGIIRGRERPAYPGELSATGGG